MKGINWDGRVIHPEGKDFPCDHCGGKAELIYFDTKERKVLSIICEGCKAAIEATLKGMAAQARNPFGYPE